METTSLIFACIYDVVGTTPDRRKTVIKNRKVAVPTWQNYLQALAFFYAWYGHFNVPSEYIDRDSGLNLGAWVKTVRNEYLAKSKNPSYRSQLLSTQRVTILEAMGFDWEHSQDEPTISWASEFLQARAGTDDKFVAWAKEQIRLMRDKGDDESRESELDFHHFQLCFRLSFLELVVDKVSAATKNED